MPIDPNRIQAVFLLAVEATDAAARAQILERECGSDVELRQRAEALLAAHDASGGFLDKPPVPPVSTVDEPPLTEGPGTRIGPYKLLQQIGEGGMGVVFLAEQMEPVQRKVALKVIKPGMDTHQVVARFEAERQALALMDHPNIAKVLDAGATESGRPYFVMELVKGLPITKYCDLEHLTPQERLQLFVPVCQAVQHAHQKGIIHRDLKPSNILIALYDGRPVPKVIDFGVAKATGTKLTERTLFTEVGHAIGTWEYMAPEQAELNNLDIDTRADIYALGATLYELLTGSPPFTSKQLRNAAFEEMLRMIREVEPPKPSTRLSSSDELPSLAAKRKLEPAKLSRVMRGDLDWIVMKCLEKERGRRYETANGLAMDVQRYLADEPVLASPPSAAYRFRKFARRHKAKLLTATLIGLVLLLGAGSIVWGAWNRAERSLQAKQNQMTAEASLARLDDLYKAFQWEEALALVDQAEGLVGPDGDPVLRERIAQAKRKTKLLHGLDKARMARLVEVNNTFDYASSAKLYAAAFAEFGLNMAGRGLDQLAQRIAAEDGEVRDALLVALDDWARSAAYVRDPQLMKALRGLAQMVDSDPWRKRYRAAVVADPDRLDRLTFRELSAEARRLSLPPSSLELLSYSLLHRGDNNEAVALLRWARARYPTDFWVHYQLGFVLVLTDRTPLALEEAIGSYRAALALRPMSSAVYTNLATPLWSKGQLDEAISCYRKSLAIEPNNPEVHRGLGRILQENKKSDEAIAEFRKAIAIDSQVAGIHNDFAVVLEANHRLEEAIAEIRQALILDPNLSVAIANFAECQDELVRMLRFQGKLDEVVRSCRDAVALQPQVAHYHDTLGEALRDQGKLDEAIVEFHQAIKLDGNSDAAKTNLAQAERMAAVQAKLPEFLFGKAKPANLRELLGLIDLCQLQARYAAAARFYDEAFVADPKLAGDWKAAHCDKAARSAALAAAGKGIDADKLDDTERTRLRQQALEWLRADLAHWRGEAASEKAADRALVLQTLKHWQDDPDLAGIRDKDALAKLPAEERETCQKLWANVAEILKKVSETK